jgi:organic hydroperoxide reductase OsmC/OhrA
LIESHDYDVEVTNTGVKTGLLGASGDGLPSIEVASPPEFGGPAGVWSPEHLFVASLSVCLMTTFRAVAEASGLEILDYSDQSSGHLQRGEDRRYSFDKVTLRPRVVIDDESKIDRTLRLLDKAEAACLISRSVASEIVLEPTVEVRESSATAV